MQSFMQEYKHESKKENLEKENQKYFLRWFCNATIKEIQKR